MSFLPGFESIPLWFVLLAMVALVAFVVFSEWWTRR